MDGNQALEDNGPCRISQPVLQRADDLGNARLARVCRDENMLNVLCLWGRILGALLGEAYMDGLGAAHLNLCSALDGLFEGAGHDATPETSDAGGEAGGDVGERARLGEGGWWFELDS